MASGVAFALVAGTANAGAVAIMGRFGQRVGVIPAITFAAFVTSFVTLALLLFIPYGYPRLLSTMRSPSWFWLVGGLSTFYGFAITTAGPRIGIAATIALVIAGQIVGGVVVDSVGAFGLAAIPLSRTRVVAVVIVAAGSALSLFR